MYCTITKGRLCYTDETLVIRKKLKKLKNETEKAKRGGFNYLEWANAYHY